MRDWMMRWYCTPSLFSWADTSPRQREMSCSSRNTLRWLAPNTGAKMVLPPYVPVQSYGEVMLLADQSLRRTQRVLLRREWQHVRSKRHDQVPPDRLTGIGHVDAQPARKTDCGAALPSRDRHGAQE
eukprot:scaffold27125_cov90-Isochrysis_galbana.AAC.2